MEQIKRRQRRSNETLPALTRPPGHRLPCVCACVATSFLICSPILLARILALSRILIATNRPVSVSVANFTLRTVGQTERRSERPAQTLDSCKSKPLEHHLAAILMRMHEIVLARSISLPLPLLWNPTDFPKVPWPSVLPS